jgi:hypothetical protein
MCDPLRLGPAIMNGAGQGHQLLEVKFLDLLKTNLQQYSHMLHAVLLLPIQLIYLTLHIIGIRGMHNVPTWDVDSHLIQRSVCRPS